MASTNDGDDLTAGQTNAAQSGTELLTDQIPLGDGNDYVLRVRQKVTSAGVLAIHGVAGGQGVRGEGGDLGVGGIGQTGVEGQGSTGVRGVGRLVGVDGNGNTGVSGHGSTGVEGIGTEVGVRAKGYIGLSAGGVDTVTGIIASGIEVGVYALGDPAILAGGTQQGLVAQGRSAGATGQGSNFGVLGHGGSVGVCGQTNGGIGVLGSSKGIGVYAHSDNTFGLWAEGGSGGISGAAFLAGNVYVVGDLLVFGGIRSAAIKHPDKSHRLSYGLDSPESWFEDFGEADLIGGKAKVALKEDFRVLIDSKQYHVFIAPYGDSKGLYVSRRSAAGFEVREQQGGRGRLRFSYRIVAKRKDVKAARLQKIALTVAAPKVPKIPKEVKIRKPPLRRPAPKTKRK